MSRTISFVDDDRNREMMALMELLEFGYIINNTTVNPADGACAENSQPADTGEIDIHKYLENKLSEANIADELVRKVNERMQDLAILKQTYKDRATHIENRFANGSTLPDAAASTAVSAREEISKLALELSLPNESQKSIVQQILNTALLPRLPNILAPEASIKPVAPAPQITIHLLNDQVILTWSMPAEDLSAYEHVLSYQVYSCRETSTPPSPANWWKIVELTAAPLPMTYVLRRFTAGKYYFAVRGIDAHFRAGPFSSPVPVYF